jgi:hypothetical protein
LRWPSTVSAVRAMIVRSVPDRLDGAAWLAYEFAPGGRQDITPSRAPGARFVLYRHRRYFTRGTLRAVRCVSGHRKVPSARSKVGDLVAQRGCTGDLNRLRESARRGSVKDMVTAQAAYRRAVRVRGGCCPRKGHRSGGRGCGIRGLGVRRLAATATAATAARGERQKSATGEQAAPLPRNGTPCGGS